MQARCTESAPTVHTPSDVRSSCATHCLSSSRRMTHLAAAVSTHRPREPRLYGGILNLASTSICFPWHGGARRQYCAQRRAWGSLIKRRQLQLYSKRCTYADAASYLRVDVPDGGTRYVSSVQCLLRGKTSGAASRAPRTSWMPVAELTPEC